MLRSNVLAAKARLAKGHEDFKARHAAGCPGIELCALNSNLRDAVVVELVEDALQDLGEAGPKGLIERHRDRGPRRLWPPRRGPLQRR